MKVSSKVAEGMVRIDFNANDTQSGKLEDIYEHLNCMRKISKVVWCDDPFLIRNGIIIGYYNQFVTTDAMAEHACKKIMKLILQYEK